MEYILNRDLRLKLADGVEASKFDANRVIATIPKNVLSLFLEYGIDLKTECPGAFIKAFTVNAKELEEIRGNLERLKELDLIEVIKANPSNLQIRVFKTSFMKRLVELMQKGTPYLNADNSFADYLLDNKIPNQITQTDLINAQIEYVADKSSDEQNNSLNVGATSDRLAEMTPEDRQVYNEIVEKLNYLVLANPMDTVLATVVNNAISKAAEAILRQELRWGIEPREMIESVMFDGLETMIGLDKERIASLVLGAFPNEERKGR
ncbi:MAG: hypothetical protein HFI49_04020 [Bacilli bacterium]|jgi:hypothetical protein|nr:hypothetical protein [Bacilli bacterium]